MNDQYRHVEGDALAGEVTRLDDVYFQLTEDSISANGWLVATALNDGFAAHRFWSIGEKTTIKAGGLKKYVLTQH